MNSTMTAEQLREIFLSAQTTGDSWILGTILSLSLFVVVMWLVKRRSLQEEYTPIWMLVAVMMLVVSLRIDLLEPVTRAIGAWTTSSTIFFLGELFLVLICLNYAVRLSRANLRLKNVAQEIALLRQQVDRLESEVGK